MSFGEITFVLTGSILWPETTYCEPEKSTLVIVSATTVLVSCLLFKVPVEKVGTTGTAETLVPAKDINNNNLYILCTI